MDAQLVWNTWRRILTSDDLVDRVLRREPAPEAAPGLTADEAEILAEYASTPDATRSNIGMYRRGLVRNALNALRLVPVSRRLLYASELDVEQVADDYARSTGYRDEGPRLWRIAGGFVSYLAGRPELSSGPRRDALAFEGAATALMRRLGATPPASLPTDGDTEATGDVLPAREDERFVAHPAAVVVTSAYDLTPWLEDPYEFAVDESLELSTRHWLIYLPSARSSYTYAELSERAADALGHLAVPRSAAELSPRLGGLPSGDLLEVIDALLEIGAIGREVPS